MQALEDEFVPGNSERAVLELQGTRDTVTVKCIKIRAKNRNDMSDVEAIQLELR